MTKRTIEIDDTRDDRVASARADLKTWFDDAVKAQPDVDPNDLEPHDTYIEQELWNYWRDLMASAPTRDDEATQ